MIDPTPSSKCLRSNGGHTNKIERGTITLGGRVTLHVAESMTREKLWAPSVNVPSRSTTFAGELEYNEAPPSQLDLLNPGQRQLLLREPGLRQALGKGLEELYAIIMKECWDRLDPAEFRVHKKQADEIKKKAGYVVSNR